jgi:hypothetical protein
MSSKAPKPLFDVRRCRICGCTDEDCSGCIERTGEPRHWVEDDLCSACVGRAPKTGLASRMRAWMKERTRPFMKRDVYLGLGIESPAERAVLRNAFHDFVGRGEILLQPPDKRNRRQDIHRYRYDRKWKGGQKGAKSSQIFKAIYVSGTFAVTDIQRLCDMERSWVEKTVRRLKREGYLVIVGRRLCAHGAGAETLYHVPDRDKFRLEVMR